MSEKREYTSSPFWGKAVVCDRGYCSETCYVCLVLQDATGREVMCPSRSFGAHPNSPDCRECNYVLLFPDSARKLLAVMAAPTSTIEPAAARVKNPEIAKLTDKVMDEQSKVRMIDLYEEIQAINDGLLPYKAGDKVGFTYKGKGVVYLIPEDKSFTIKLPVLDKKQSRVVDYMMINVSTGREDLSKVLESIQSFINTIDRHAL